MEISLARLIVIISANMRGCGGTLTSAGILGIQLSGREAAARRERADKRRGHDEDDEHPLRLPAGRNSGQLELWACSCRLLVNSSDVCVCVRVCGLRATVSLHTQLSWPQGRGFYKLC